MAGAGRAGLRMTLLALAGLCVGASPSRGETELMTLPDSQIEPLTYAQLPGWDSDDHAAAFKAFAVSCGMIMKNKSAQRIGRPIDLALRDICRDVRWRRPSITAAKARHFFEHHFRPLRISKLGETDGFLTGYYEPVVQGSRVPTQEYTVPMYRRPSDLVAEVQQQPGMIFPNKGLVLRQVDAETRVPYYDRAEIEGGALDGKGLEICWLKDPVEAFSIQIQGSARVRLEDGVTLRLNYDGHNGHPYTPIGRLLIERNIIPREQMTAQKLREWMNGNPEEAKDLRRLNKSFVFFRVAELGEQDEAVGAQGISLTAGRSLAVDRKLHGYGTPFWIDAELPLGGDTSKEPFRRLMIAQDTGSAMTGPARADIYFGTGKDAGRVAGRIRNPAKVVMLVPRSIDPIGNMPAVPFPPRKPKIDS
jgi:membrane-bound lytic murein transglycosylase A